MAKSEPPGGPRAELGKEQRVAKREPSVARLAPSQPGVRPLPITLPSTPGSLSRAL